MSNYTIIIAEYNSSGIRTEAAKIGATHMREIGRNADNSVKFFAIPLPEGGEIRVADTNGDPVWEENDLQEFSELAEECGVTL